MRILPKKVRCVAASEDTEGSLTNGKVYEVEDEVSACWQIKDDAGHSRIFFKGRFEIVRDDEETEKK